MSSTRERILETLLARQRCTINELAEVVGINPISVRHHIIKLQAERLVGADEERHGVGRPRHVYYLTQAGQERFPTRYLNLTNRLLERLKEELPEETIDKLFSQMGEDIATTYAENKGLGTLSLEERLQNLQVLLEQEGFNVEWKLEGDEYHIREMNCPYYHIGQNHPEVCVVDQALISKALAVPVQKVKCILHGDSTCTYVVPKIPLSDVIVPE